MLKISKDKLEHLKSLRLNYHGAKAFHTITINFLSHYHDDKLSLNMQLQCYRRKKRIYNSQFSSLFQALENRIELKERKIDGETYNFVEGIEVSFIPVLSFLEIPVEEQMTFSLKKDYKVEVQKKTNGLVADIKGKKVYFAYNEEGFLEKILTKLPLIGNLEIVKQ